MNALILSMVGMIVWPFIEAASYEDPTVAPHFPAVDRIEWPDLEHHRSRVPLSPPNFLGQPTAIVD